MTFDENLLISEWNEEDDLEEFEIEDDPDEAIGDGGEPVGK